MKQIATSRLWAFVWLTATGVLIEFESTMHSPVRVVCFAPQNLVQKPFNSRLAGVRDNLCDSSASDSIFYQIALNWDTRGHSPALRYNGPSLPAMCVAVASLNPTLL